MCWLALPNTRASLHSQQNNYDRSNTNLIPSLMNHALDTFLDRELKLMACTGSSISGSCINSRYALYVIFCVAIIPSGTCAVLDLSIFSGFTLHCRRQKFHHQVFKAGLLYHEHKMVHRLKYASILSPSNETIGNTEREMKKKNHHTFLELSETLKEWVGRSN